MIPFIPDADNAAEGKSKHISCSFSIHYRFRISIKTEQEMHVLVNNEQQETTPNIALAQLLSELKIVTRKGVAVAVNEEVVPRTDWNSITLKENDNIMIITATQGG
jgi:sulfur carrier protein